MRKRVDVPEEVINGFVYTNVVGSDEYVDMMTTYVRIIANSRVDICYQDIPKLMRALKEAYEHKTGEKLV